MASTPAALTPLQSHSYKHAAPKPFIGTFLRKTRGRGYFSATNRRISSPLSRVAEFSMSVMSVPFRSRRFATLVILFGVPLLAAACNGAGATGGPPGSLTLALSSSTVVAPQDGTQAQLGVTVAGADSAHSVSVAVTNLPNGVTAQFTPVASGLTGPMAVTASGTASAGAYSPSVVVTNGNQPASQSFALVVAIAALVGTAMDTSLGVAGRLEEFMATSFQPAEWDYQFFQIHTATEPAQLGKLGPQHIRLQAVSQAVPMKANSNPQQATDWDFTKLDAIVQPVLTD